MLVKCLSFGSIWWCPIAPTLRETKVFNTTGFDPLGRQHRYYVEPGEVRFNCNERPPIEQYEIETIGVIFHSPGIERVTGPRPRNRLLLHRRCSPHAKPDRYLLKITSAEVGRIDFSPGSKWRNNGVRLLAASSHDTMQETLLLIDPTAVIKTDRGTWELACLIHPWKAK